MRKIKVVDHMAPKKGKSLFSTAKPSSEGKITRGINTRSSLPPEIGKKKKR